MSYPPRCSRPVPFTCTRKILPPSLAQTMKSYRSLSPQGKATPNPIVRALSRNAACETSPNRFGYRLILFHHSPLSASAINQGNTTLSSPPATSFSISNFSITSSSSISDIRHSSSNALPIHDRCVNHLRISTSMPNPYPQSRLPRHIERKMPVENSGRPDQKLEGAPS